ncbi:unnamed protein product [Pleuronectes platessa]|uniref:Uncharacterized protein n=1 Tax=Pleuronectes platessa TaxID=8262 RepID=A0A9N7UN30_PLEPL|nr:unnamed protein product [Pleuronectes platessa]
MFIFVATSPQPFDNVRPPVRVTLRFPECPFACDELSFSELSLNAKEQYTSLPSPLSSLPPLPFFLLHNSRRGRELVAAAMSSQQLTPPTRTWLGSAVTEKLPGDLVEPPRLREHFPFLTLAPLPRQLHVHWGFRPTVLRVLVNEKHRQSRLNLSNDTSGAGISRRTTQQCSERISGPRHPASSWQPGHYTTGVDTEHVLTAACHL